jgi:uncharacterized membrane protein YfcA
MFYLGFVFLGVLAGSLGGIVGIGGGIIMVPLLISAFGFDQKLAQGTSLAAMIPPVGLLAAYVYYKNGNVNILAAMLIAAGFLVGSYGGALLANSLSKELLQRIFGFILLAIGAKFAFFK